MTLRHLFTVNLFTAIFFGLMCALFPFWAANLYGLETNPAAIWTTRLVGGSILGYATLLWYGRKVQSSDTRRAIGLALLVQDVIGLLASIEIQFSGAINALGWSNLLIYGLLSLGYVYFLFVRPQAS